MRPTWSKVVADGQDLDGLDTPEPEHSAEAVTPETAAR